jgi:hypothetical protein
MVERVRVYEASPAGIAFPSSRFTLVEEKGRPVAYARWLLGNDYRNRSTYYGAYPPGLMDRVRALFPDLSGRRRVLHVFSGSLPAGDYTRCDMNPANGAELVCDVLELPRMTPQCWDLVIADPPYSAADAEHYGTPMIHRGRVLQALAAITRIGGYLAWLDTCWPMHRAEQWATVGRIVVTRSTNHRTRDLTIFQRRAA